MAHCKLAEFARQTGLSEPQVRRRIRDGRIAAKKGADGHWYIPSSEIERLVNPLTDGSNRLKERSD